MEYAIPTDIARDSVTPVGPQLLAWLKTLPNGTSTDPTIPRFGDGRYCTDQIVDGQQQPFMLDLIGKVRWRIIDGEFGSDVTRAAKPQPTWRLNHCTDVRFLGAHRLIGPASDTEAYVASMETAHGIHIYSSYNIEIDGVTFDKLYGNAVYCGLDTRASDRRWSDTIRIRNCRTGYLHRQQVAIVGARNVTVEDNHFGRTPGGRAVFDIEPNGSRGGCETVNIVRNEVGEHGGNFVSCTSEAGSARGVNISLNKCLDGNLQIVVVNKSNMVADGWYVGYNEAVSVNKSVAVGNGKGAAMQFTGVDNVEVCFNRQALQMGRTPPMHVARFWDCTNVDYHDNWPTDDT